MSEDNSTIKRFPGTPSEYTSIYKKYWEAFKKFFFSVVLLTVCLTALSHSQDTLHAVPSSDSLSSSHPVRKSIVFYSLIAHSAFTFYVEYTWWWQGNYHPFHFSYEGFFNDYSLGVDKIGHLYISNFYTRTLFDILQWAGYDRKNSLVTSASIAAGYALAIEIGDGFSRYTFSPDDLGTNLLGIGYALLQIEYPFFDNIEFKWSYYPSGVIPLDKNWRLTHDYDGHLYWMTFRMHNLLPRPIDAYWPRFLNLAIGYGVKNFDGRTEYVSDKLLHKFAVSLDYNVMEIPSTGDTWESIKRIINRLHFPAPGIRTVQHEGTEFKPLLLN